MMVKFVLRGTTIKEFPQNLAHGVMRVLRREGYKFSHVGNVVHLGSKKALPTVCAFE